MKIPAAAVLLMTIAASAQAATITVDVPGTSDMWLAGMPAGSTASAGPGSTYDVAPDHSPVLVPGLPLDGGAILTFAATGGVSNTAICCAPIEDSVWTPHADGSQNGLSDVTAPLNTLMGVFLSDAQPSPGAAPPALDFYAIGLDFGSLAPALQQVFFIGNGSTGGGVVQQFIVPVGATRLFLGTMDGFGWFNNTGAFTVDINYTVNRFTPEQPSIPEPSLLLLLGTAAAGFGLRRSRRG